MDENISTRFKTIRRLIANAQIEKAFKELLELLFETKSSFKNQTILLYSDFNRIKNREELGIGEYNKERNRIIFALLGMIDSLEVREDNLLEKRHEIDSYQIVDNLKSRVNLLEKNIDLLTEESFAVKNSLFKSLKNSTLWDRLLPKSKEIIESNNIILNDRNLNNYLFVIDEYLKLIKNELFQRVFIRYKNIISDEVINYSGNSLSKKINYDFGPNYVYNYSKTFSRFLLTGNLDFSLYKMCHHIFIYGLNRHFGSPDNLVFDNWDKKETRIFRTVFKDIICKELFIKSIDELENNLLLLISRTQIIENIALEDKEFIVYTEKEAREIEETVIKVLINLQFKIY